MLVKSVFLIFQLLINSNSWTNVEKKESEEQKYVVITIDDLPAVSYINSYDQRLEITDGILSALKKHDAPGVGFVNESKLYQGKSLMKRELDLLQKWIKNGLVLGNHGFSHLNINSVDFADYKEDILKGEEITVRLMAASNHKVKYYRHPFLRRGNTVEKREQLESYLVSINYQEAPVTIDNSEWIFAKAYSNAIESGDKELQKKIGETYLQYMMDKTTYYEQQTEALFGNQIPQILLIHANILNAHYLDQLLLKFEENGYQFASLETALTHEAYNSKDDYVGNAGISWIHRWALTAGKSGDFFKGEPVCPQFIQDVAEIQE